MTFPIAPVIRPADLTGQNNGKLSSTLLRPVNPNKNWQMHHLAARAWEALRTAAWANGVKLSVSGNPYRSYDQQVSLFNQRYTSTYSPTVNTLEQQRVWNGTTYYKKLNVAPVAVPGSSNHGWGLAVDTAIDADGDLEFEWPTKSLDQNAINWLLANAPKYGFSWELQSEPWHIRYVAGDKVPTAVLAFEKTGISTPTSLPFDPANGQWGKYPTLVKPDQKNGARNDYVKYLQGVLKRKAGQSTITVDGYFGDQTETAVKNLQKFLGLTVDGWVGSQTWKSIDWLANA